MTVQTEMILEVAEEQEGDVTVVVLKGLLKGESIVQSVGKRLYELVEVEGRKKIVIDFSDLALMWSTMIPKLITLKIKLFQAKGQLRLCAIRPDVMEVFTTVRKERDFRIMNDRAEAVRSF